MKTSALKLPLPMIINRMWPRAVTAEISLNAMASAGRVHDRRRQHLARPHPERKLQAQRVLPGHRGVNPLPRARVQLRRPAEQRFGFQPTPIAAPVARQPALVKAVTAKARAAAEALSPACALRPFAELRSGSAQCLLRRAIG